MKTDSKTRTIAINGRFLTQAITGVQRYAYELLMTLDKLLHDGDLPRVRVVVYVPTGSIAGLCRFSFLEVRRVGRLRGQLWEQVELPFYLSDNLLFTPCGGAPLLHRHHVMTIHDAGPFRTPRAYRMSYRTYYRALQRFLSSRGATILTVSEFSRQELIACLGISEDRVIRTYESGEHIRRAVRDHTVLTRNGLADGRYVLAVGSANPNKNLDGLMRSAYALRSRGVQVAIAGGTNARIFSGAEYSSDSIRMLGVVSDGELRSLYEHAGCFVFPSFYEGFGLPPMEALSVGCPVVAARAAALPEVFGSAARYCDPHSPEDMVAQICRALEMRGAGRQQRIEYANQFSWERCARETWAVLLRTLHVA